MSRFPVVNIPAYANAGQQAKQSRELHNLRQIQGQQSIDSNVRTMAVQKIKDLGAMAGQVKDQETYDSFRQQLLKLYPDIADQVPEKYDPAEIEELKQEAAAFAKKEEGFTLGQGQKRFDSKGNVLAQVAPKPSGSEADISKINEMIARGYPKEIAEGIVYKTIRETKDPMGLGSVLYNYGSDNVVGKIDEDGNWVPGPGSVTSLKGDQPGDMGGMGMLKELANINLDPSSYQSPKMTSPDIREGTIIKNPRTGERMIMKGGQWQPIR